MKSLLKGLCAVLYAVVLLLGFGVMLYTLPAWLPVGIFATCLAGIGLLISCASTTRDPLPPAFFLALALIFYWNFGPFLASWFVTRFYGPDTPPFWVLSRWTPSSTEFYWFGLICLVVPPFFEIVSNIYLKQSVRQTQ